MARASVTGDSYVFLTVYIYSPGDVKETLQCRIFHDCVPTYSFLNTQPLTSDVTRIAVS